MFNLKRALDCYQQELLLNKPNGYVNTHCIQNAPNDVYIHRYKVKLCSKNTHSKLIINPTFEKGDFGTVARILALERSILAYLGYYSVATRGESKVDVINQAHLYNMRNELNCKFNEYADDMNKGLIWHLSDSWFQNPKNIVILHNFLSAVMTNIGGFKMDRDPLSPIRNFEFASQWMLRMNGDFEVSQLQLLEDLKKLVTGPLKHFWPNITETYYSYKMVPNNRGLFVEIDVLTSYKFTNMDKIIRNLLDSRKDTFFDKLFPIGMSVGADLAVFSDITTATGRVFFNKVHHPYDYMRKERFSFFMTIENQKKLAAKDDFSSSDDENFLSPSKESNTRSNKVSTPIGSAEHQKENPLLTPRKPVRDGSGFKTPESVVSRRKKRKRID